MPTKEWKVDPEESGMKLGDYLKKHFDKECSSRQIKRFLDQDYCQVNRRIERYSSTLVHKGDVISLFYSDLLDQTALTFDRKHVLFEDEFLFAYDKPPRINSDEAGIGKLLKSSFPHLRFVHRLDQETSGVLLFAKDAKTEIALLQAFKNRLVEKEYIAVVDGIPKSSQGHIENTFIIKSKVAGQTCWGVAPSLSEGKLALTDWRLEKQGKGVSLVRCFPKTGRTHQLRVHLNFIGHPILGDFQYAKSFSCLYRPARMLLHAERLSFIHPHTQKKIVCIAPLPDDFLQSMRDLNLC